MLDEEVAGGVRLPAEFREPGSDVNVEVWTTIQHSAHPTKILGIAADVRTDEGSLRMPPQQPLELLHNLLERREVRVIEVSSRSGGVEVPIGTAMQFLPALVETVERLEEGNRI